MSEWMRIFTEIVFDWEKPRVWRVDLAAWTMEETRAGWFINAAPRVSAQAQDCGHPQFISMPFAWGARRVVVRDISSGEFTPSWAIVGGGKDSKLHVRNVGFPDCQLSKSKCAWLWLFL